ncbi:hypothetical protein [Mycolicibacterium peregrinum]
MPRPEPRYRYRSERQRHIGVLAYAAIVEHLRWAGIDVPPVGEDPGAE